MTVQKQQAEILIKAPMREVYAFITDWSNTPRYERLVKNIERAGGGNDKGECLVNSYLTILGLRLKFLYRYWFVPLTRYGGVQVKGFVRGGFWFKLTQTSDGTHVVHGEFITSRCRILEILVSFLLWKAFFPADLEYQLIKLKELIETNDPSHHSSNI